jgi:GTPase SAR1 family protein
MKEHYISQKEYRDICGGQDIKDKEGRETLVEFLHDLGVILHFKDLNLKNIHVLEPRWVTEAVYKIINSKALAEQSGVLKLDCLEHILEKKTDDDFDYPTDKHGFIIELMKKFEPCYRLESAGDSDRVLIPDLLKKEEPSFEFDYDSALRFIIRYDFLPKSIMPRFIVRRHKDIKAGLQWRTGVVLEDTSTRSTAVVRADERERRVGIYVTGDRKRDFFSVIRKTFGDINASFEKLDAAELVPLPGHENETVTYKSLIGHMLEGKSEIFIGELRKSFSVSKLLDGIEKKDARKDMVEIKHIYEPAPAPQPPPPPEPEKKKWYHKLWHIVWQVVVGIGIIVGIIAGLAAIFYS